MMRHLVVAGSGAFGTALAAVAALDRTDTVLLYGRDADLVGTINRTRINNRHLPGISLPDNITATAKLSDLTSAGIVLFAIPSQSHRQAARSLRTFLAPGAAIISCAKGIERDTGHLMTDVLEAELPGHPVSVLSGPGFAADIARGLPTAMVLASSDADETGRLAGLVSSRSFRLYPSKDRIGVQIGGALKNVLAIAAGMVEGAGLGESARAALIARGLAEMGRLAQAMGGQADTIAGLSGLGDLVLTATSQQSRNNRFGAEIGRLGRVAGQGAELVEGAHAAPIAANLGRQFGVELPITDAVAAILDGQTDVASAMTKLMSRPLTRE